MKNIKLFELLETFSKEEFDNFGFFLNSPYLNSSQNAIKLFEVISEAYPDFDNEELTKESIFRKIYPNDPYKDKKIRDLFSKSLELAENYLAFRKIGEDSLLLKSFSISELAARNLGKHFEQSSKEMESILGSMSVKNSRFFFYNYILHKEKHRYAEDKEDVGKREKIFADIYKEIDQFVLYFVSNMLVYYSTQLGQEKLVKHDARYELLDELLAYLEKKDISMYPEIKIMYNSVILQKFPERSEIFYVLKKLLKENSASLEKEIRIETYIVINNYSKERALYGDASFKKEYFNITKEMLEEGIYPLEDNYLPEHTYISIAGDAMIQHEYEWAANFIEAYKQKVRPENRDNAFDFVSAMLNYRLQNYDKALKLLAKVRTHDFYYTLRVKNHFLKIYFETNQFESVLSLIDSFRHFLTGSKNIPDYLGSRFLLYINFLARICTAIHAKDKDNLVIIRDEIGRAQNVENRSWMSEQIDRVLSSKIIQ